MENDIYNQNEIKFYTDIYKYLINSLLCDISGNISAHDIHEFLITSSKLSKEIILQIGDVTGGSSQGWYNEKQVFLALKLVAAAQQGFPIPPQIPLVEIDLPLPDLFTNNNTEYESPKGAREKDSKSISFRYDSSPNLINLSDSDCPPPKASDEGYQIMISEEGEDDFHAEGVDSEPTSNFTSHSPSISSPASDSPTPTNSGHDKHWNQPINSQWHSIVNEEHHQLLGTEEESSDRHSSEGKEEEEEEANIVGAAPQEEAEGQGEGKEEGGPLEEWEDGREDEEGDEDEDDAWWMMTDEQQHYYTRQFITMQPDLNGFLPGTVAKPFFEKSKLPVAELRQIWQLADASRDGALSLEEFFAAMHLVVLRRNKFPLPDKLPRALMPKSFKWTKFVDSPTSTVSSPGPKPVNFDFHKSAVEKDPKILHPTPLRVTPEAKRLEAGEEGGAPTNPESETGSRELNSLTVNPSVAPYTSFQNEQSFAPKPQPKMKVGHTKSSNPTLKHTEDNGPQGPTSLPPFGPLSAVTLPHPPPLNKDVPPPPPPRPSRTHVRSSSLDLNKFNKMINQKSPPTSAGSPNVLLKKQSDNGFAWDPRGTHIQEETPSSTCATSTHLRNSSGKHNPNSAFEVYKKPVKDESSNESRVESATKEDDDDDDQLASLSARPNDKREVLSSLQTMREKNSVLLRVNSELNQELAEVMEERIALEFQLEQMKSFSS